MPNDKGPGGHSHTTEKHLGDDSGQRELTQNYKLSNLVHVVNTQVVGSQLT